MKKKLSKSSADKKLDGVCGGLGEYFGIDSVWIRIAWVVFCLAGGSGILAYILFAIVMPSEEARRFEYEQEMRRMNEEAVNVDYEVKD